MHCLQCGNGLAQGARFCGKCGTPVAATEPAPEPASVAPAQPACPSCGTDVKPGAKFCGKCGYAFAATPEPAPASEPVRPAAPVEPPPASAQPAATAAASTRLMAGLLGASALLLIIFAWWLNAHSDPAPLASVADAASDVATTKPSAPVPNVARRSAPVVAPVDEVEIIETAPVAIPPPVAREQARREAQERARQREADRAKLDEANKTLDELLK